MGDWLSCCKMGEYGVRCTCVGCVVRWGGKGIYLEWLPAVNVWGSNSCQSVSTVK